MAVSADGLLETRMSALCGVDGHGWVYISIAPLTAVKWQTQSYTTIWEASEKQI